jgi:hypothetical protein
LGFGLPRDPAILGGGSPASENHLFSSAGLTFEDLTRVWSSSLLSGLSATDGVAR